MSRELLPEIAQGTSHVPSPAPSAEPCPHIRSSGTGERATNWCSLNPPAPSAEPVLDNIEQYRMQMAGICTAALGYWKEGEAIHPDYDTPALRDVARLYAKYRELHDAAPPAPSAEPVAWVDERAVAWLESHPLGKITTQLEGRKTFERPMPLYAAPPPAPSAEPVGWIARYKDRAGNPRVFTHSEREVAEFADGITAEPLYTTPPDHREAMQQALEALVNAIDHLPKPYSTECSRAENALRKALEGRR